jgi:anti-anti-sigma regulatory factor/HAMP domain-containing protein
MSIRIKLFGAFALNLALLLVVGGFAVTQMSRMNTQATTVDTNVIPSLQQVNDMRLAVVQYRSLEAAHVAALDTGTMDRIEASMKEQEQAMNTLLTGYRPRISSDEEQLAFNRVATYWNTLATYNTQELVPARRNQSPEVALATYRRQQSLYTDLLAAATDLANVSQAQGSVALQQVREAYSTSRGFVLAMMLGAFVLAGAVAFGLSQTIIRNLRTLTATAKGVESGDLEQRAVIRSRDEVGQLATSFNQMIAALGTARSEMVAYQQSLETRVVERTAELEQTLHELRETIHDRDQLITTVNELSSPVVPVLTGILVMPLIGVIDSRRAAIITNTVASEVARQRAHAVIIDMTGVPIVDTEVAQVLIQAAQTVRLLGAQSVLVGLRPELVQTIVGLGLDLSSLITCADLQSGVLHATKLRPAGAPISLASLKT